MTWKELEQNIIRCEQCPRLRSHCRDVARVKRRQFIDEKYWGRPVPGFGDKKAHLWIVGLAPAAHGANRTGRMFTGDSSGDWLYRELHEQGFASAGTSQSKDDGMELHDAYVSAAARCAPPDNKPTPQELATCFPFLKEEKRLLRNLAVILALGKIGFESVLKLLPKKTPKPRFQHGQIYHWEGVTVVCSYHPSRQNTQTGRLTRKMWKEIFSETRSLLSTQLRD